MNKKTELVKNTAIITFGRICTQLVSFFLLPLYTTILSTEETGTVDLVITYSSLLIPFITAAIEQALFRFLIDARKIEEDKTKLVSTSVLFVVCQCFISAILIGIVNIFVKSNNLIYFGFVTIASSFAALSLQLSRGLGDNIGFTLGSAATAVVQVLCNILFLVVFRLGAPGMMLAVICGNAACTIIIFFRCRCWKYIRKESVSKESLRALLKYSLPLIPNQLSWWTLHAADKVIVQFFIGLSGNGIIFVSSKFSSAYTQFSNIFNVSWTESAALHINDNDAKEFFSDTINIMYRLFLSACFLIITCMPIAFPILVPNKSYAMAYGLIPIFMIASLFNALVSLYGVIYVAFKLTKEIAKTAIYAAIVNVVSHLALIKFVGLYAAPLSTMISYGCMAFYRYFDSKKYLQVRLDKISIISTIIFCALSFSTYYSNMIVLQIISLLATAALSIYLNKQMILKTIVSIRNRIRK